MINNRTDARQTDFKRNLIIFKTHSNVIYPRLIHRLLWFILLLFAPKGTQMPCYTLLYLVGLVQNNHLQTNRKKDWRKKGQINGKAGSNSHPSIQPARQTARQPDRQTNTQTNSETYLPCLTQASEMRLLWKRSDEVFFVILLFCYFVIIIIIIFFIML